MNMTARTIEYPFREGHLLAMSAGAACLARIGRIDSNVLPASFFRFARELTEKCRPRGICNAFGKTMSMGHAVDLQVFHTDDPEPINDVTTVLMGEIATSECYPLMYTGHRLTMLATLWCAFRQLRM